MTATELNPHAPDCCPACGCRGTAVELEPPDPEYADVDEDGQLSIGVAGEQRAIPGLARPREEQ